MLGPLGVAVEIPRDEFQHQTTRKRPIMPIQQLLEFLLVLVVLKVALVVQEKPGFPFVELFQGNLKHLQFFFPACKLNTLVALCDFGDVNQQVKGLLRVH